MPSTISLFPTFMGQLAGTGGSGGLVYGGGVDIALESMVTVEVAGIINTDNSGAPLVTGTVIPVTVKEALEIETELE